MGWGAVVMVAVAVVGAAGPAPSPATSPPGDTTPTADTGLPAGVGVAVEFPRYLQAQRRLEAIVLNDSDDAITVEAVQLDSVLFEVVPETTAPGGDDGMLVRSGRRTDFRLDLGPAVCPAPPGHSELIVTMRVGDDPTPRRVRGVVDPAPLEQISDVECGEAAVREQIVIGLAGDATTDPDGVITTSLVLDRLTGDSPVAVTATRGSVLYSLDPARPAEPGVPIGRLDTSPTASIVIPVVLRVVRCDPHAVADVKKPYDFKVWVTIGDGSETFVSLDAPPALQEALLAELANCVAGG